MFFFFSFHLFFKSTKRNFKLVLLFLVSIFGPLFMLKNGRT
jgi:hypothetical protein